MQNTLHITQKKTIREMDFLRAFAITVLLITHLHNYVDHDILWKIFPYAALTCLSIFVFVSGSVINLSSQIISWQDIVCFLRRRFVRIYSLYIPALITFMILHPRPNMLLFGVVHLFSLQVLLAKYIGEPYPTLWFIGIIVPYYIIFALVKKLTSNLNSYIYSSIVIFIFGIVFNLFFHVIDIRLFTYYPAFVFGVCLSETGFVTRRRYNVSALLSIIFFTFSLIILYVFIMQVIVFSNALSNRDLREVVKCLLVIPLSSGALYLSQHTVTIISNKSYVIARYISSASFAVYLFHRPILDTLKKAEPMIIKNSLPLQYIFYICFVIPLMFLLCFYIQDLANKLISYYRSLRTEPS